MKNLKLIALLIALLTITLTTTVMAVTVEELENSPLTSQQKLEVVNAISAGNDPLAQTKFDDFIRITKVSEAEAYKSQLEAEAKLEAEVKIATEQKQVKSDLVALVKPLKINEVWEAASAFVDSTNNEPFVASTLAKRYKLNGDYVTIQAVQTAYEARVDLRATILSVTAPQREMLTAGLQAHNQVFVLTLEQMGKFDDRLTAVEENLAKVTRLTTDRDGDIKALKAFIVHSDSNKEVNEASKRRFEKALKKAHQNTDED